MNANFLRIRRRWEESCGAVIHIPEVQICSHVVVQVPSLSSGTFWELGITYLREVVQACDAICKPVYTVESNRKHDRVYQFLYKLIFSLWGSSAIQITQYTAVHRCEIRCGQSVCTEIFVATDETIG